MDTFEFTTSRDQHVVFKINTNAPLLTKCELYDSNNNCMLIGPIQSSVTVHTCWRYRSAHTLLETLLCHLVNPNTRHYRLLFVEGSQVLVSFYVWMYRVYDPSLEMYQYNPTITLRIKNEDVEKLQLLKTIAEPSVVKNEPESILDASNSIQCHRCGFINSETSTVCRECNALLKGNAYFTSSQHTRYY